MLDLAIVLLQVAGIIGSWHGTSTCVDMAHWPSCHNEEVIYDVRQSPASRDSVILSADRVVNGTRVPMGDMTFGQQADGWWVADFRAGQTHVKVFLRMSGTSMSGTLVDVASGRRVRALSVERVQGAR